MSVLPTSGTLIVIGPRPRIWCSAGTGLFSHGWAGARPSSSADEREALALRVFEVERGPAVTVDDRAVRNAEPAESFVPIAKAFRAGDAHSCPHDAVRAAPLARQRPIRRT